MPETTAGLDELLTQIGSLKNCHLSHLKELKPKLSMGDLRLIESNSQYHRIFIQNSQFPTRTRFNGEEGWMITVGEFFPEDNYEDEAGYIHTPKPEEVSYWWRAESSPEYQILEPGNEVYFGEATDVEGTGPDKRYIYSYSENGFTVPDRTTYQPP